MKKTADTVKLSIIVVNWNTQALLKQCLDSLVQSSKLKVQSYGIEVILVDNGSTDGSVEYLNDLKIKNIKLKIIYNADNLGFAKANNQGLKVANGEYIMLLNSDTVVKPEAMSVLITYLEQHPNTAVSPQLLLPNGQAQNDYYMKFPNPWQIVLYHHPILRPLAMSFKVTRDLLFNSSNVSDFSIDQLPGASLVASREIWNQVGGLDENYKFFFEDVDWSWRAMKKGIKRVVVPKAEIVHFGGASWKQKLNKNKTLVYCQNFSSMLLFCQKNYSYHKYLLMRWAVVLNMILTLKLNLAWYFIKTPTKQTDLW